MNRKILSFALALFGANAFASPSSLNQAYQAELSHLKREASMVFNDEMCNGYLSQSWGRFSGDMPQYQQLERRYLDGASMAPICGLKRGWAMYLWLTHFEEVRANPAYKKRAVAAQLREATNLFMKMPISKVDGFLARVNCSASTPRTTAYNGYFNQTVNVNCTTELGPAIVNLDSLYITVGGKDVWNSPREEFFGKSFRSIVKN